MVPQKTTRASKQPKTKSIFGFTLIELIVIITILAILGTIGFLSIWGYSSKARDSARIGDVAQISKSLDVSIVTRDSYPTPDNSFSITYSGGILWNQGTIGNTVMQSLRTSISWGGLNKKPVDPLDNSEYVYSSLAFGKSYQIQAEYEGDLNQTAYHLGTTGPLTSLLTPTSTLLTPTSTLLAALDTPSLIEEASAAPGTPTIAYVKGNYSWLMARTVTGSYTYILALPSIITSTGTTSGNKIEITTANALSGTLLFHGRTLRAASAFNPNLTPVFSGSGKVLTTNAEITTLMTNLKNTYANSGATDVKSNTNIASLLTLDTNSLTNLGSNLVKNDLGITNGGGGGNGDITETPLYAFTSHTFTSCWVAGQSGPSLTACRSSYNGAEVNTWKNTYLNMTQNGYQEWTVPVSGMYQIEVTGAEGGTGDRASPVAGKGAFIRWDYHLAKNTVLRILVGQKWGNGLGSSNRGGGGWGGTFVTNSSNSPIIIAAWWNGDSWASWVTNWVNGQTTNNGNRWWYSETSGASYWRGGGGGWFTNNGTNYSTGPCYGYSFMNWWNGGTFCTANAGGVGWFWGGGGSTYEGGGGGWYSGGDVVQTNTYNTSFPTYGAWSYNTWSNPVNTSGVQSGNGYAKITKL